MTKEIAKPVYKTVIVAGEEFKCPMYIINGKYHARIRDIAYMVKGNEKQFNVMDILNDNGWLLGTSIWKLNYNDYSIYEIIGNELSPISNEEVMAKPYNLYVSFTTFAHQNIYKIYPNTYKVNNEYF